MPSQRSRQPSVYVVHRIGAVVLGLGLWVFAALGFVNALPFFSTTGVFVLGLSTNGALSTLSLVVGATLIGTAWWGEPLASTATAVFGVLFVVSGLAHLALLGTDWNILAFRLPNVFFSLIAGLVLMVLGFYGRVSGGLPPDNPYRQAHPRRRTRPTPQQQQAGSQIDDREQEILQAEIAMGEGHPTPAQEKLVLDELRQNQQREYDRAWRQARRDASPIRRED